MSQACIPILPMSHGKLPAAAPRCGAIGTSDGSVAWRVWAPRTSAVELVLYDDGEERDLPMLAEADGYFALTLTAISEGQLYAYRLDGGPPRPDPASQWQPDGIHRPSALVFLDRFAWDEGHWTGQWREPVVIYELHVGTFTPEGTFDAVIPRLEALCELGITAIELMPVGQFPGRRGWGYDGVHPYAVQNSYGGPRGLQRLIAACHRAGLAVILDVIYNHAGPEGNYLSEFGPYFTDRYHTPWGAALNFDGEQCEGARGFVLHNVRQWVRDFRIDGLRLDAVHAIWDNSPLSILHEIKEVADDEADCRGRPVRVIAESNVSEPRLLLATDEGGYGLDGVWCDDFHHAVHALLAHERGGYYRGFGSPQTLARAINNPFLGATAGAGKSTPHLDDEAFAGRRYVVAVQNHDQVGNRPAGDRFGTLLSPAQQRLAAGLLLLAPQTPLIFMGEEYGEMRPFPFFCDFEDPQLQEAAYVGRRREMVDLGMRGEVLDPRGDATFQAAKLTWSWPEDSLHAGMRSLYYDLISVRRQWLPPDDSRRHAASLLPGHSYDAAVLRLIHASEDPSSLTLIALFNLSARRQEVRADLPPASALLLSSELVCYGGCRESGSGLDWLHPFEFCLFGLASRVAA